MQRFPQRAGNSKRRGEAAALAALAGLALLCARACVAPSAAWAQPPAQQPDGGRRAVLSASAAGLLAGLGPVAQEPAWASGGATAGKYSTIPSAKRRFYGRVRQGIYQFLCMEQPIMSGNLKDQAIEDWYGKNIIKQKGGEPVKNCAFGDCTTKEKRTSRWLDFKIAADLLGSGFRYDASDVNDYLPQVRLIRAFGKKVEKMQKAIEDGDVTTAQTLYQQCKTDLNRYTPMVELAPLNSEDYTHEWDTRPQVWCQGSFCV